jgi:hypothetical protein
MIVIKKYLLALLIIPVSIFALPASENENGDAGNTPDTAQVLTAGINQVFGEIQTNQDTDLYKFALDTGGVFTIEVKEIDEALDMNLIVFNGAGQGLAGDDDDNNNCSVITSLGSLDSCLTLTLAAGEYFFAVGDNNMGAFESLAEFNSANDFIDNDSGILGSPTSETLGLSGPEGGPTDFNDVGRYEINFSQAVDQASGGGPSAISQPIPSLTTWALAILALLIAATGVLRRRSPGFGN